MPVLEPHPQNGQRKLLLIVGLIIGLMVAIGVIASIAAP
ncbi:MAG: SGM_5486 family transporter-associated protein [Streptomyces sp.]